MQLKERIIDGYQTVWGILESKEKVDNLNLERDNGNLYT